MSNGQTTSAATDDWNMNKQKAHRTLSLFLLLDNASGPLTSSRILSDDSIGYNLKSPESARKAFQRDRANLLDHGIVIEEIKDGGHSNLESSWQIDRDATYARLDLVRPDEAEAAVVAIDEQIQQGTPLQKPLMRIRSRLLSRIPETYRSEPPVPLAPSDPTGFLLWNALKQQTTVTIDYCDMAGSASKRTLSIYGMYPRKGNWYVVALDDKSGEVRTFRADRIAGAVVHKRTYAIPDDFELAQYRFLPFDIGAGPETEIAFSFPGDMTEDEVNAVTHGRGSLDFDPARSRWIWTVRCKSVDAAAAYALRAGCGMLPLSPAALVDRWRSTVEGALRAHA